ncbi:MAG TPA: hypothetical protein VFR34_07760 [Paracoccaceae bacterium]|nr:hypothetical protein [Paracoccaceae bacterium]
MRNEAGLGLAWFPALALAAPPAQAADARAGRERAREVCALCHGLDGIALAPDAPNLAAWYARIRVTAEMPVLD